MCVSTKKNYDKKIALPIFILRTELHPSFDFFLPLFSIEKEARLVTFTTICDRYSFSSGPKENNLK